MTYLDFDVAMSESSSWIRAANSQPMIERRSTHTFTVMLPGGEAHRVTYATERGAYVGFCDCDAAKYHATPCAHLCALRQLEAIGVADITGRPIKAEPRGGPEPEPDLLTDGSGSPQSYAAGHDGQPFGRPDQRL